LQEKLILSHLLLNEEYGRKIVHFLKPEYFSDRVERKVYELIERHVKRYNAFPTKESLASILAGENGMDEALFTGALDLTESLEIEKATDQRWLIDETEKFCRFKALTNAISESIKILEGKDPKDHRTPDVLPQLLTDALSVSFEVAIGHDYFADADRRFDFYHVQETRIPFDLRMLNRITRGGLLKKTLTVLLASTGVGKTMFMCHLAAFNLMSGKNVLYISGEMQEEKISERIDANLLGITTEELRALSREDFQKKVSAVHAKTKGNLVVKEFPPASVHSGHIRHLIQELRVKKKFIPDVIYVDYLNLFTSARMKMGGSVNTYVYIKSVAEEIRALAVEFDVPVITATQSNREGFGNSDLDLDNTSESWGLPATADLMLALISNEELEEMRQIMVKQLKNRYDDVSRNKRFTIGMDRSRMKFYDLDVQDGGDKYKAPTPTSRPQSGTGGGVIEGSKFQF